MAEFDDVCVLYPGVLLQGVIYSSGNSAVAAGRRACIFDYLFKGKLINLNLKLIGFDVYYSESGARVTRVLALKWFA
jgi:hypothetical protein